MLEDLIFTPDHQEMKIQMKRLSPIGDYSAIDYCTIQWTGGTRAIKQALLQIRSQKKEALTGIWKPQLTPEPEMTIGDRVFRSPVIVFRDEVSEYALIPDIQFMANHSELPWVMNFQKADPQLYIGIADYRKERHVYHKLTGRPLQVSAHQELFRFYLAARPLDEPRRTLLPTVKLLEALFGENLKLPESFEDALPALIVYENHAYHWAFDSWRKVLWNDFGNRGGISFIVTGSQSPNNGETKWREPKAVWNQLWFSDVRVAYGMFASAARTGSTDLAVKAKKMVNLALSSPQENGLFPSVYQADTDNTWHWENSNRGPGDATKRYHLTDMAWTCYWLMKIKKDFLPDDQRINKFVVNFLGRLLTYQDTAGAFPSWVEPDGTVVAELTQSGEVAVDAWLLAEASVVLDNPVYLEAAKNSFQFIENEIIPTGRWEDFELYWSCSRFWEDKMPGQRDPRSDLYNQNNFSMYWTVMAGIALADATGDAHYIDVAENVSAEVSLYQAIWDPPYWPIPVKGGFGVMSSDDEWNDARESLFAVMYSELYQHTGNSIYLTRAYWAMRASYYMMNTPENKIVNETFERMFPFFNQQDYGFEMENAFHGDHTPEHFGEFAIFSWGSGSASTSLEQLLKTYKLEERKNVNVK